MPDLSGSAAEEGEPRRDGGREEHLRALPDADPRMPRVPHARIPLTPQESQVTERMMKEIRERLRFLLDVGMDYLSLDALVGEPVGRRRPADPGLPPRSVRASSVCCTYWMSRPSAFTRATMSG